MRKILVLIAAFAAIVQTAAGQENPSGTITYALPQTSLSFDVEAQAEYFYAGPYARFAQKYLGVEARLEDEISYQLAKVTLTPLVEADQTSRYTLNVTSASAASSYLKLTSQGLIATTEGSFGQDYAFRFPAAARPDFSDKGVNSNYTSQSTTLYRASRAESEYSKVSVQQDMVVEKSLEKKAQEAASMIFTLRRTRVEIITGDTDATYSGEAMNAAIEEITRLEKEYMSLFIGYSEFQSQKMRFDVVPAAGARENIYVAFRLSETEGLLPADNLNGKPYFLDVIPQEILAPKDADSRKAAASRGNSIMYRIPAMCDVKLSDGVSVLLQARVPVYQFGIDNSYPINTDKK